ncbi:MAG TPA: HVA1 family protein [Thermoanaerobaculia bacterium]|nr:HVA1 family protein [Thermoanaerobaculia bacterium]
MRANLQAEIPQPPPGPDMSTVERWRAAHRILGIYEEEITKEVGGRPITCRGTEENPVVLVENETGDRVLKLASELEVI